MPEPTNTPSAPSCIISAASAGRGDAAGGEVDDRQAALRGDPRDQLERRPQVLGRGRQLRRVERLEPPDPARDRAHVAHGLDDVAGAGLALGADHRRALGDAPQRLAEVGRAAHERHLERPLVDVVRLVGGRQDLGLVDVVDLERLSTCASTKWPMRALAITGIVTASWISRILVGSAMRATPPSRADVGGHALERHHRARAGVLGDLRLLGVGDTSMMTPPLSISARPLLTRKVPVSISRNGIQRRRRAYVLQGAGEWPAAHGPVQPAAWQGSVPHGSINRAIDPSTTRLIGRRARASDSMTRSCGSTPIRGGRLVTGGGGVPQVPSSSGSGQPRWRSGPMSHTTSAASPRNGKRRIRGMP